MLSIEEVANRFEAAAPRIPGKEWMARCPCHNDKKPSLSISLKDGRILLNCFAGCDFKDIMEKARPQLRAEDLRPEEQSRPAAAGKRKIVAYYYYPNSTRKVRYDPKEFSWQHLEAGRWKSGLGGAPHVPYLRGNERPIVYICEGEKDADNLSSLGFYCLSSEHGAGRKGRKWYPEYNQFISGKDARLLCDNDEIGRSFMGGIAAEISGSAHTVKIYDLAKVCPDLPEGGDISDLIEAAGPSRTIELLSKLEETSPFWEPPAASSEGPERQKQIDSIIEILEKNKDGSIKATYENFMLIFENDPEFSNVRYSTLREFPVKIIDGKRQQWTDRDDSLASIYIEKHYGIANEKKLRTGFNGFLANHEYDPLQETIKAIQWDGIPRCEEFLVKWMKAEDDAYSREVSRLLFAGGINRAFNPGCKFDCVVVLIGRQGNGKSTLCRWLALDEEFYTSAKTISGKQGLEAILGKWIVELEELLAVVANQKSGTVAEENAKQFLSGQIDYDRLAYGHRPQDIPRHCIFIGTTNRDEFLTDKTGNRRWFPCRVNPDEILFQNEELIKEDIRQCWAEMYHAYVRQDPFARPYERPELRKLIKDQQSEVELDDYREGIIAAYLRRKACESVCIQEIWEQAIHSDQFQYHMNIPKPSLKESRDIAEILTQKLHWKRGGKRNTEAYGPQKVFLRPESGTD